MQFARILRLFWYAVCFHFDVQRYRLFPVGYVTFDLWYTSWCAESRRWRRA